VSLTSFFSTSLVVSFFVVDAASKYPSADQIIQHCSATVFVSVKSLISKPAAGEMGVKYKELLHYIVTNEDSISALPQWNTCFHIIHEAITEGLGEDKILLPSVLLDTLGKNIENILVNFELRKQLCELLEVCVVSNNNLLHCFLADFTYLLVTEIFKYYCSSLKDEVQRNVAVQVELDIEDLEAIHYISGSVVRSFYKKSVLFPKNVGWSNISKLILEKLLESDTVAGPPEIVKGWTKARSKGKLFFVSGLLFDFFVGVAKILHEPTQNKLRVDSSLVIESVCHGCVVLLWDEAVGDCLNEKASYQLMCGMISSFCTTFAVGRSKELLNKIRKNKAEASLALRARVAPRPKT
jgi:hypothetical protein